MRRGLTVLLTAAVAAAVAAPADTAPPPARAGTPLGAGTVATSALPAEQATTAAAVLEARRTGGRVAIGEQRTDTADVYANPDGTFTLEQHTLPVRVRRGTGWVPIDTTLRAARDGSIAPAAVSVPMAFSGGGNADLARIAADGTQFSLGWPGTLPGPELAGDTATYRNVLPDVDLVITADTLGFSEVLVVKTAAASRNPALRDLRLPTRTVGLSQRVDASGNIDVVDAAGQSVFHAGTPLMWDSAGGGNSRSPGAGRQAGMRTVAGPAGPDAPADSGSTVDKPASGELRITPDAALLDDPATSYPVYIDPSVHYSGARLAWTSVWKAHPTSTYYNSSDIARVGHENDTGMTNRSFFRMNTSILAGKHIITAKFKTWENHSWSCSARQVEAWLTGAISSTTSWNTQPAWSTQQQVLNIAKGYSSSCPDGTVEFTVTNAVSTAASSGWPNVTLGLRATSETDTFAWKKFANNPTLEVDYNSLPAVPTTLSIDPGLPCVTGTSRPVVPTVNPTFRAKVSDPDSGQTVNGRFEWWVTGGAKIGEYATAKVASGSTVSATVPVNAFANGGTYSWQVRAEDGTDTSTFAGWCELTVDTTAPGSTPVISSTTYPETPPTSGPIYRGAIGIAGTFNLSPGAGDTDLASYLYSLNVYPPTTAITGRTAAVSVTPTTEGLNTFYARGRDAAGNLGPVYGYQFYVRPVTMPVGLWRLDETAGTTAADTSGDAETATATGGVTWTAGRIGGATRLDGSTGALGTATAPVRTDMSFTASAWVRLDGSSGNYVAVSEDGTRQSGFQLGYAADVNRWTFGMVTTDNDTETLHRAVSTSAPQLHVWTHLLGIHDKTAGTLSLYVDGTLAASTAHTAPWNATGGLQIGRYKWRGTLLGYWPGDLDDVQVFQGVLPPDSIVALARPAPVLVGHWALDETSGSIATDTSGAGRTATLTGSCVWTPGWFDGSLGTDGACDGSTATPVVRTDQSFTVAAWVRFSGATGYTLYTAVSQDGVYNSGFLLQYMTDTGQWGFSMPTVDSTSDTYVTARSPQPALLDTWTHLAGVYDATAGQMRLYVDGTLVAITARTGAWHATGATQIGRAKWHGYLGDRWLGGVDDVQVFQGALSDDAVYQLTVG